MEAAGAPSVRGSSIAVGDRAQRKLESETQSLSLPFGEGAKPSLHEALALLGASVSGNLSVETDVGSDKHLFL